MGLSVQIDEVSDLAVVHVAGRIEPSNFQTLGAALSNLLQRGLSKIILNCDKLDYLNTAEVPLLIGYEEQAHSRGGDIKWAGLNEDLAFVINLLDSSHHQQMYDNLEQAVKAFKNGKVPV